MTRPDRQHSKTRDSRIRSGGLAPRRTRWASASARRRGGNDGASPIRSCLPEPYLPEFCFECPRKFLFRILSPFLLRVARPRRTTKISCCPFPPSPRGSYTLNAAPPPPSLSPPKHPPLCFTMP